MLKLTIVKSNDRSSIRSIATKELTAARIRMELIITNLKPFSGPNVEYLLVLPMNANVGCSIAVIPSNQSRFIGSALATYTI